jgi:hypothetical protein
MKENEMRFLILHSNNNNNNNNTTEDKKESELDGFLSFMFTHDSTPSVPVLYIYEIHLSESARGKGLGGFLMRAAEEISRLAGVEKVMLTCFLSNENALNFYQRLGFEVDVSSPGERKTRKKVVKAAYVIMSKVVVGENGDGGVEEGRNSLAGADEVSKGDSVDDAWSSASSVDEDRASRGLQDEESKTKPGSELGERT